MDTLSKLSNVVQVKDRIWLIYDQLIEQISHMRMFADLKLLGRFLRLHQDIDNLFNPPSTTKLELTDPADTDIPDKAFILLMLGGSIKLGNTGFNPKFFQNYLKSIREGKQENPNFLNIILNRAWILLVDFYLKSDNWTNHRFNQIFELKMGDLHEIVILFNYLLSKLFQLEEIDSGVLLPFQMMANNWSLTNPTSPIENYIQKFQPEKIAEATLSSYWELMLPNYDYQEDFSFDSFDPPKFDNSEEKVQLPTSVYRQAAYIRQLVLPPTTWKKLENVQTISYPDSTEIEQLFEKAYDCDRLISEVQNQVAEIFFESKTIISETVRTKLIVATLLEKITSPNFYEYIKA